MLAGAEGSPEGLTGRVPLPAHLCGCWQNLIPCGLLVRGPLFLPVRCLEAAHSSLPYGPSRAVYNMAAGISPREQDRAPKVEALVFL